MIRAYRYRMRCRRTITVLSLFLLAIAVLVLLLGGVLWPTVYFFGTIIGGMWLVYWSIVWIVS